MASCVPWSMINFLGAGGGAGAEVCSGAAGSEFIAGAGELLAEVCSPRSGVAGPSSELPAARECFGALAFAAFSGGSGLSSGTLASTAGIGFDDDPASLAALPTWILLLTVLTPAMDAACWAA